MNTDNVAKDRKGHGQILSPALPKRKFDIKSRALGLPFFVVGAAMLAYAISLRQADVVYNSTALQADGVVVDVLHYAGNHNQDSIAALVEFHDAANKKFRVKTPKILAKNYYNIDGHVTMLYQPGHPQEARVWNAGNSAAFPFAAGGFGLIILSVGLLIMLTPMFDTVVEEVSDSSDGSGSEELQTRGSFAAMDRIARRKGGQ